MTATTNYSLLTERDIIRCPNVIIHPNGRLYGNLAGVGCDSWFQLGAHIAFVDTFGSIRFLFGHKGEKWEYDPNSLPDVVGSKGRHGFVDLPDRGRIRLRLPKSRYRLQQQVLPNGKDDFEIVVAKFKEDIAWTEAFSPNATIYSKDPSDGHHYQLLANLGREGGTYFFHIVKHFEELAKRTLFLQGDPFPHPLLPFDEYANSRIAFTSGASVNQSKDWVVPWSGKNQQIDRAVMTDFLRLIECDPEVTHFRWTQGAQFSVSREQIRLRSPQYYSRLYDVTQQQTVRLAGRDFDNHHVAWLFELFWRDVFSAQDL